MALTRLSRRLTTSVTAVPGINRAGITTPVSRVTSRVRVIGVKEAIAKFRMVGSVAGRETGLIVYRAAGRVEKNAKNKAPVGETGNLRDGIHKEKLGPYDWGVESSTRYAGSDREYAGYVEYGTSVMDAQPYLRPAIQEERAQTVRELQVLAARLERL